MKLLTLALCLSASVAHSGSLDATDQTIINNVTNTSGVIVDQVTLGNNFVAGAVNAADNNLFISNNAYTQALITDAQQDAYNNAINSFLDHSFYNAQDQLVALADVAKTNLESSVDSYTDATVALRTVTTINSMASSVSNTVEAEALQDYAVSSGAADGVTDTMQDNYNNSLSAVNKNTQEFAAYSTAAIDPHLAEHMDQFADQYGAAIEDSYTSLDLVNGYITTTYYDSTGGYVAGMSHSLYFTTPYSDEDVYQDGEAIYQ